MNFNQIENKMKTALMERSKDRSCFINNATGNLLSYNDKKYIITCRHVADEFFSNSDGNVLLRGNKKISKSDLKYVTRTSNSIDIAIIEILKCDAKLIFYTTEDFEIIDNFNQSDDDKTSFFVFGYPSQLKYEKDGNEFILWMSYLTLMNKSISSTKDFLYLDYPTESEMNIISERDLKTILPEARGLSGAFIFKIKIFKEEKAKLWLPSLAKIVAIQSTWNKKSWLKGCNTKYLFDQLDQQYS